MTLREQIDIKNKEIQAFRFNEKDTFVIKVNIPTKLQELIGLIKSIESSSLEFKNWVKENSLFYLEESINNCKKCYNSSSAQTITSAFLKTTIEECKKMSVEAVTNLYSTAEFFEVKIRSHEKKPVIVADH
jgi:hypothetical protein